MLNAKKSAIRAALTAAVVAVASACSTLSAPAGFDAYGYLSPNPTADGEFIGNFPSRSECEAAGEAWMSQQVVGNPVHAECYPVDRR